MHTLLNTRDVNFYIFIYVLKQRQRARRASYRLLKHKTNNYYMYMYTLFTK